MESESHKFTTIDEYIATFPEGTQRLLQQVRTTIQAAAPGAEEKISYQMAAFALQGILVYFAGFKHHIGFYPTGSGIDAFRQELGDYVTSKGTVQFRLDRPLPLGLIERIVRFRVSENLKKAEVKALQKKAK